MSARSIHIIITCSTHCERVTCQLCSIKLTVLFISVTVIEYLMGFNETAIQGTPDNYGSRLGCHWFAESPQYTLFFRSVTHSHKIFVYSVLEHINTFSTQSFSPYMDDPLGECILSNIQSALLFHQREVVLSGYFTCLIRYNYI